MAPIIPLDFDERFSNLKRKIETLFEIYINQCKIQPTMTDDKEQKCNEKLEEISNFLNHKIFLLKSDIKKKITEKTEKIDKQNKILETLKNRKKQYQTTITRLDRGDLSSEPRRSDSYIEKVGNYSVIIFYIVSS